MWLTIFILVLSLVLFLYKGTRKPSTLPSGLPWYPFIGSGPHLAPNLHVVISKMRKIYGKIFTVYLGNEPLVIVADFDLYKEAMAKDELLYRPKLGANDDFFFPDEHGEMRGIMFANGKEWQEQRRFTLKNLRDFGFGKLSIEGSILEEVEKCNEMLSNEVGTTTQLSLKLNIAILNALWKLLTGEKLEYDSLKSKEIVGRFNEMFNSSNIGGLMRIFPWLKHICPDFIGYTNVKKAFEAVQSIVEESYQKHLETFDSDNLRDFTDAYIKQQFESKDDRNSSFYGNKGKLNYMSILFNLFAAGSDTTANTINFILWYLCKYPLVQSKLQREIDSVVGKSRMPSLSDKPNLSYFEAVANEVQRIVGVAFMGIFRMAKTDITIGGPSDKNPNGTTWHIPKNTMFTGALHEMMRDPEYFDNPTEFLPERFIDENGKYHPHEKLVPFGIGKRSCPGKTLADTEVFLFLASFVQRFQFSFPKECDPPETIKPEVGFILVCPPYDIVINER